MKGFRNLQTSEEGSILVECALFSTMLVLVIAGITDYGFYIQQAMAVQDAAVAAADYASAYDTDQAGMQTWGTYDAGGLTGFTITTTALYSCTVAGTWVPSDTACSNGQPPFEYIQVATTANASPVLPLKILSNKTLTGYATYRVR